MDDLWLRYRRALAGEPLPAAFIDLDAVDSNVTALLRPLDGHTKTLRLATKSVRCPALYQHLFERGGPRMRGLMTYTAAETAYLASEGHTDLLLAYPTAQPSDAAHLADANLRTTAAVVVDDVAHLACLDAAARARGTRVPVVIDVDLSYRPLSLAGVHLGVRRSPLRTPADVLALARQLPRFAGLRLHGLMGYEAQIAGVPDRDPLARALKALSRPDVARTRAAIAAALRADGLAFELFNGGGSGSVASSAREDALTEVTAGSGFLDSHLFDHYDGLSLAPAAYFALQVVRTPAPGFVACHGGGFVASGPAGASRLPIPALPRDLELVALEGAGEVQTPLRVPRGVSLALGDPVMFRHAKAGELAEHFNEYLLVRGDRVVGRAPTYRGLGRCFLG